MAVSGDSEPWVYGSTPLLALAFVAASLLAAAFVAAAFVAASFVTTAHRRVLAESPMQAFGSRFKHSDAWRSHKFLFFWENFFWRSRKFKKLGANI